MSQPQLPLPDAPLIVEDLLTEAKRLADAGAAPQEIQETLDQVEQLRAGRG